MGKEVVLMTITGFRCGECETVMDLILHVHCPSCGRTMCRRCYFGKVCPECEEKRERDTCPDCGGKLTPGKGILTVRCGCNKVGNKYLVDPPPNRNPCPDCEGTGKVVLGGVCEDEYWWICETCKGTGKSCQNDRPQTRDPSTPSPCTHETHTAGGKDDPNEPTTTAERNV